MSVPAVLIRISTGEIIKHAPYPNAGVTPVIGLDPDLKWLVKHIPFEQPDYDSRIYKLITTEDITELPHPTYPDLDKYEITYATDKRLDEEIGIHIENSESEANETLLPYQKRIKLLTLAVGVLFRRVENLTLNPKEQLIGDKMVATAVRVWKNDAELRAKLQQLVDGEEPNIDEGWERD